MSVRLSVMRPSQHLEAPTRDQSGFSIGLQRGLILARSQRHEGAAPRSRHPRIELRPAAVQHSYGYRSTCGRPAETYPAASNGFVAIRLCARDTPRVSWDLFVMDLPPVSDVADIPSDFKGQPLGTLAYMTARIKEVLPDADFSDPFWGTLSRPGWSIEFNMGREDPLQSFAMRVHGGGDAMPVIADLLIRLGYNACDPQVNLEFSALMRDRLASTPGRSSQTGPLEASTQPLSKPDIRPSRTWTAHLPTAAIDEGWTRQESTLRCYSLGSGTPLASDCRTGPTNS